jgi:hypothetical protein
LEQERRVTVQPTAASKKRAWKPAGVAIRTQRRTGDQGLTAEERVQAAEFTRMVDGFEARLDAIDAAMSLVMKRLKG